MPNLRSLALIGAGKWGKNLARNFFEQGSLHTICDLDCELLSQYQAQYPQVNAAADFLSVLRNPSIHQVVIATPIATHYALSKQALLAGKDVLVEKPLCMHENEADELVQLAKDQKRVLMVGHVLQYHPAVLRLQEIIRRGELGALQSIVSMRMNPFNLYCEGDVLWDLAPHDISLILSVLPALSTQKLIDADITWNENGIKDHMAFQLLFNDHICADVCIGRLQSLKEQKMTLSFEKGTLIFDDTQPWEKKLTLCTQAEMMHLPVDPREPLREECLHFLDCCAHRKAPKTDGEEGRRVVHTLIMAEESYKYHALR
jgi:UDP-2-acetamido-3-amino-2,3-dideoxy-glucuronate N-acetyltransferase